MSNTPRLGTAYVYDNALRNIGARQSSLSGLQENLSSGKRVVRASDDPVAAAQAERALTRIERIKTDQRALETQRNAMALAESTLGEATNLIQEARQLIVNAGDPTLTAADRRTVANQLSGLREQLVSVANRKDTNGIPVLSALGSAVNPFAGPLSSLPDYAFDGLAGQTASGSVSVPLTLDGDAAFMFQPLRDGATNASLSNLPPRPTSNNANLGFDAVVVTPPTQTPSSNYEVSFNSNNEYVVTDITTGKSFVGGTYDPASPSNAITITGAPQLDFNVTGTLAAGDKITLTRPRDRTLTTSAVEINPGNIDPANLAAVGKDYRVVIDSVTTDPSTQQTQVSYSVFDMTDPSSPQALSASPFSAGPFPANKSIALPIDAVPGIRFEIKGQPAAGDTIDLAPSASVFSVLDRAIEGIGQGANNNAVIQAVGQALGNIDKGLERVLTVRGQAGEFLNRADRISGDQEKRSIQLEGDRSRAEDLDIIQGLSDFQNQQTAYSAALQSYAQIQKLSLFNFIG